MACNSFETGQLPATRVPVSSLSATFSKKLSTRADDSVLAALQQVEASLSSTDWNDRMTGVRRLHELVDTQPTAVARHFTKVCSLVNFSLSSHPQYTVVFVCSSGIVLFGFYFVYSVLFVDFVRWPA